MDAEALDLLRFRNRLTVKSREVSMVVSVQTSSVAWKAVGSQAEVIRTVVEWKQRLALGWR